MKHERSCCPIACTLDLVGDKWSLLVVRDLLLGRTQFKEFSASPERIASNILSSRLAKLVDHGLVERFPAPDGSRRDAYRLTAKGASLAPVIKAITKWGLEYVEGAEQRLQPKRSSG